MKNDSLGGSVTIPAGSSHVGSGLVLAKDTVLYWAIFSDAADEAGISRHFGGIHFIDGDLKSRTIGHEIGTPAWKKSQNLFGEEGSEHSDG